MEKYKGVPGEILTQAFHMLDERAMKRINSMLQSNAKLPESERVMANLNGCSSFLRSIDSYPDELKFSWTALISGMQEKLMKKASRLNEDDEDKQYKDDVAKKVFNKIVEDQNEG